MRGPGVGGLGSITMRQQRERRPKRAGVLYCLLQRGKEVEEEKGGEVEGKESKVWK